MIDIYVARAPGNLPGDDIVEPLLTSVGAAQARGLQEIEDAADSQPVTIQAIYNAAAVPGALAEIHDSYQGTSWRGQVENVRHLMQGSNLLSEIDFIKPRQYNP